MYLPHMPCVLGKTKKQSLGFLGINLTENTKEGELKDCTGVSFDAFPNISVCAAKEKLPGYSAPSDMFEHNNALAVVQDNMLYYDGKPVCNVLSGKKQFAVVNSKLCIFPDKIMVDIKEGSVEYMEQTMVIDAFNAKLEIADNSIKGSATRQRVQNNEETISRTGAQIFAYYRTYTYGTDKAAVEVCYKNGQWTDLEKYEELKDVCYNNTGLHIKRGDIFIPQVISGTVPSFKMVASPYTRENGVIIGGVPDKTLHNNEGYYCVITDYEVDLDRGAKTKIYYDVYKTDGAAVLFSSYFKAGDAVNIENTPFGIQDAGTLTVTKVDEKNNTMFFENGSMRIADKYCVLSHMLAGDVPWVFGIEEEYMSVTVTNTVAVESGKMIFMKWPTSVGEKIDVYIWDNDKKKLMHTLEGVAKSGYNEDSIKLREYNLDGAVITVRKVVPDLDYICESGNRLWGLNCGENTIYVSQKGAPHRFYNQSAGKDSSYSLTVGSEDGFTAICSYGGGVCCFKENKLHKILGSYPAQYTMNEYSIEGVQKGCERSVQITNETLYYKGRQGVFAYSGALPKCISHKLGQESLDDAAAAVFGGMYYLSGKKQNGSGVMYVYDIKNNIWIKQSDEHTGAFACTFGGLYMLTEEGVFREGTDKSKGEFMVEFAPFYEDAFASKSYTKLLINAFLAKGSYLRAFVKYDKGTYTPVFVHTSTCDTVVTVPIRARRCRSFSVKLEGRGDIKLKGMLREYALLSEV